MEEQATEARVKPEASIGDLAAWLFVESEDEETAFVIAAMDRLWSPTGVVETHHEEEGRPGWLIAWEPFPDTAPPRARAFSRLLLKEAPAWQPVVMEFAPDKVRALQWPGVPVRHDRFDDVPAILLELSSVCLD